MVKAWSILGTALLVLGSATGAEAAGVDAAAAKVTQVKRQSVASSVTIGGRVSALQTVVLAAQLPGRIKFIAGQEGGRFNTGTLLVALEDDALLAQLEAARAENVAAQAAIRDADAKLQREIRSPSVSSNTPGGMGMPSMMDQMFMNPMQSMIGTRQAGAERYSDLVSRQTGVTQARTTLLRSQSQIKEIEASLRDSKSIAPFNGVIVKRYVEPGDTVQPGQPLLDFADTSRLEVKVEVPARLRSGLREGMTLPVRFDDVANGSPEIEAVVSRIFPVADSVRHTVPMELLLPADTRAVAGMYAEVSIPEPNAGRGDALLIPRSAVVYKGGLPLVFVVDSTGNAVLRLVRLGEAVGDDQVVALSGLTDGLIIVTQPSPGMKSGDPVSSAAQ